MNTLITAAEVNEIIAKALEHPVIVTLIALFTTIMAAIPIVSPYLFSRLGGKLELINKNVGGEFNSVNKTLGEGLKKLNNKIDEIVAIPNKVVEEVMGVIAPVVDLTQSTAELVYLLIEGSRATDEVKEKARTIKATLDAKIEGTYTALSKINENTQDAVKALHGEVESLKGQISKQAQQVPNEASKKKPSKKARNTTW